MCGSRTEMTNPALVAVLRKTVDTEAYHYIPLVIALGSLLAVTLA